LGVCHFAALSVALHCRFGGGVGKAVDTDAFGRSAQSIPANRPP